MQITVVINELYNPHLCLKYESKLQFSSYSWIVKIDRKYAMIFQNAINLIKRHIITYNKLNNKN